MHDASLNPGVRRSSNATCSPTASAGRSPLAAIRSSSRAASGCPAATKKAGVRTIASLAGPSASASACTNTGAILE
ncbi:hypothetical protein ACQEVF_44655 [Nonomuraea polychroma]|uniref:hypothetical protein n=1 Tax=Nonomuraea polychroma TaxID=46176 RepID=UPI003D93E686